jgi:HD-like signal output (HDOD) protein
MKKVTPQLRNMLDAEQEAFRVTHQEAGGYLASFWKLPFPIVEAALYHHRPLDSGVSNTELLAAVHLAQHYAWQLTKQSAVTELYTETFDILNIDKDSFEAAVNWNSWL